MPIPQLNSNHKSQSWRNNKKKYYISRNNNGKFDLKKKNSKRYSFSSKNNRSFLSKYKKHIFLFFAALFLFGVILVFSVIAWLSRDLPNPNQLIDREIAQSTKIYDRTGETVLYEIHGEEERTLVNLEDIPDYLKNATIAIEDKDFYSHKGFSFWAIFRTFVTNILRNEKAGASTLTQQFVKNSILTSEKKYTRKIKEIILAYRIEKRFSKDEILQMYLNEIPYGSTAYGIEAASYRYFGKSVREINLAEAAVLAALPQAPSLYSPYGSNKESLIWRQQYILDQMVKQGYIEELVAEEAKNFELEFKKQAANITAPHFVMYVKEILSEKYGEKMIEQGGLKIYTTLDLYKQNIAEEVIAEFAEKNEEKYNATNASLVSIDPKTGQILAMVGSKDYFNDEIDGQVNIATSKRQPGSSMKPLVFATSFLKGYTPNTILYDVVTNFSNDDNEPYEPHNYDDQEHGPVTIRKALAGSLNIPAVKAIYLAGINNVIDLAQDLGYSTLNDRDRFGLSLVLGGGEVKLLEHVNAYSAFAREGYLNPVAAILKIEDKDGRIVEEYKEKERRVLDSKVARQINDILSDNDARAYAFGESNWLTLGDRPIAAKTGTTNDYRDAWTLGYTPSIVTGVWVGNNDNSEMKRGAAGGTVAAPIWHDYMKKVLGDTPVENFKEPEISKTGKPILDGVAGLETIIEIDKSSGLLATEFTPKNFIEKRVYSQPHCILYFVDKKDPLGEAPKNPENDPQFNLWEERVVEWNKKNSSSSDATLITNEFPPTEIDNIHTPENLPIVELISPSPNQTIMEPLLISRIKASAPRGIKKADYYIDSHLLYTNSSYPYNLEKNISFLDNGFHNLQVNVCDDVDNCTSKETEFNLILEENKNKKNISISLISPANGLAVSNFDFPLNVNIELNEPSFVAQLDCYYSSSNSEVSLLDSKNTINTSITSFFWLEAPPSGSYRVYCEATTWSNNKIKSEDIILSINNTKDVPLGNSELENNNPKDN